MQDNTIDFQALVANYQRDDNYINATKWCAAFGKSLKEFTRLPATKAYLKALEDKGFEEAGKSHFVKVKENRVTQTYVHPLVAIS